MKLSQENGVVTISGREVKNRPRKPVVPEKIDVGFEELGWLDSRILMYHSWSLCLPVPSFPGHHDQVDGKRPISYKFVQVMSNGHECDVVSGGERGHSKNSLMFASQAFFRAYKLR